MKKIYLVIIFFSIIFLASCNDTRIMEINNIIWKDDYFNIYATSNQLQNQYNYENIEKKDEFYSSIKVFDCNYYCTIYLANNFFDIEIYDEIKNQKKYYYGNKQSFINGSYSKLVKEKNKEYKYSLIITLKEENQYYDYCIDYGIEFPKVITLYGYEDK